MLPRSGVGGEEEGVNQGAVGGTENSVLADQERIDVRIDIHDFEWYKVDDEHRDDGYVHHYQLFV